MRLSLYILMILSSFLLISCASSYTAIIPEKITYTLVQEIDSVSFEYKYDILEKKYAKKENKKGVKVVAVKLTNNTDEDIIFGNNVKVVFENDSPVYVMDNFTVYDGLKQKVGNYLWYLLLVGLYYERTTQDQFNNIESNRTQIGLVIAPLVSGGNMIVADLSNRKFKEDLTKYDIIGKVIKPGETVYGLIGIRTHFYDVLKIKVN